MPFDDKTLDTSQTSDPAQNVQPTSPVGDSTPPAPQFQAPPSTQAASPDGPQPGQGSTANSSPQIVSNAQPHPDPNQNHPSVQKANLIRSMAEALAGGPRYTESIDADGNRIKTPVRLTGKEIGMAIALEAIHGSLTGLAAGRGRGPGAAGAAAMGQQIAQRQQAQQVQDQQAQTDFVNKASAYAANLRTRAMAQEIGMRDEQSHKEWIAQHASTANYVRENKPDAIIKDNAPESEVTTPEFTREALQNGWSAIPVGYVPRYDAQGNHYSKDGVPLHDNLFMVVDSRKLSVPQDVLAKAQEWGLPGFTSSQLQRSRFVGGDVELRIGTVLDTSNKIAALDQEQRDLDGYYGYLNAKGVKGADGNPLTAPNLKQMVRQNPALISHITGAWSNHFAESPSAALKAMKDDLPAKGPIANLYGGKQLLDKYDLLKDIEKKGAEKQTEANIEVGKEKALIPIKAATAGAEAKARAAATATSSRNEDGSWNMGSIPVALVEANMDPSQLSKRSADYTQKLQDANAYSMQKYGRPFDIAQATTDYRQANNGQVQNMLKMVGAMSAPNGELAIAVNASKALPQLNSSLANKVFNIAETQFGSDAVTNFHTAMIGFSDLYAKVMGGGVGTDALRQSAMDVLKDGYSHGQIAGSIKVLQQQIEARKDQMIGTNPYLRKQFGGLSQNPTSSSAQAPPVSLLKEGTNTTFANGQTWTVQNGQPVQVK